MPKYQDVFDAAQEITDHDGFFSVSVLAIDTRKCELEITAKKKSGLFEKNTTIVNDTLTYNEAYFLLKGIQYGRYLPT